MGQFVSVASCPLAAHFESTWLYILCTLSLVSSLICSSWVNKPTSPTSPGMPCTPHSCHGLIPKYHISQTEEARTGPSTPGVSPVLRRQDCHLPQSASCTLDSTAQDVVCFLCTLLTHAQFVIHWDTQAFFCEVLHSQSPTTLCQFLSLFFEVQNLTILMVEPDTFPVNAFPLNYEVLVNRKPVGLVSFTLLQLDIINKPSQDPLSFVIQDIYRSKNQCWPQYNFSSWILLAIFHCLAIVPLIAAFPVW